MMHVKFWLSLFLACPVVVFMLPVAAAAAPTGGHVSAAPASIETVVNREIFNGRPSRGEAPLAGDERREATPVERVQPVSSSTVIPSPYATTPRYFPLFWYGQNSIGGFPYANCANPMYALGLVSAAPPNLTPSTGCFGGGFPNGAFDTPAQLAPGHNKDALYGPMYNPNTNSLQ